MSRFKVDEYSANKLNTVCIAHRGFSGRFPENTILAFREAIKIGADVIEFDVQLTSDNQLIIYHDKTLLKFLKPESIISQMTLKELQSLDIGRGEKIPTFEQVLEEFSGQVGMNIHLKASGEIADRVIAICKQTNILDEVFLAIERKEEITRLKKSYPDVRICSLFNRASDEIVETNKDLGIKILQPAVEVLARNGKMIVEKALNAGMIMNVFYADCFSHFQWLKRLQVAGILTNYPDMFFECFGRRTNK